MTVNTSSPQDALMAFGKKWWLLLILGILSMVVGVMALNNPVSATATLVLLFGIWLLFSGIGTIIRALSDDTEGSGKVLMIISGSLSLILAVIFFNGGIVKDAQLAALFMGITFIFRGMAELVAGLASKGVPGRGWAIFMGIITLIAGVITINNPIASLITVTQVMAFFLIILGVMEIVASFQLRGLAKKQLKAIQIKG
ncbi:MAG: HdeD family acid-resistance protein [Candidatus Nanopelagicales bacterium]